MKQIFSIAFVAFSAVAIASGQDQGAIRDQKKIVEQVIRKLDNERIQAQIHAVRAALDRIYACAVKRRWTTAGESPGIAADKAASLERWKSFCRQLPDSDG